MVGTWTRPDLTADTIADPLQTSRILCVKSENRCTEAKAYVSGQSLFSDTVDYTVDSWTASAIILRNDFPCATEIYTIDLNTEAVSGVGYRRTRTRDCAACHLTAKALTVGTMRWKMASKCTGLNVKRSALGCCELCRQFWETRGNDMQFSRSAVFILALAITVCGAGCLDLVTSVANAKSWHGLRPDAMGWTFDGFNGNSTIALYRNLLRIAKSDFPQLWVREEFSEPVPPSGNQYRASMALWEFNCAKKRKRRLRSTFFADNNLSGTVVFDQASPRDWDDWAAGTFEDYAWNTACPNVRG